MQSHKLKNILLIVCLFQFHCLKLEAQTLADFIERVQIYQDSVKIEQSHIIGGDKIDATTFDIEYYTKMFSTLKLKIPKYKFDCFYFDNFLEGNPYIYVKKHSFNLLKSINKKADKIKLKGEDREDFIQRRLYFFLNDSINRARNNVIPDDTEEGYLQYLFFYEFGEQFALKWHAGYKRKYVIATQQDIKTIIKKYTDNELFSCDTLQLQNFSNIDTTPMVKLNDNDCIITWFEIETHYGIFQRTYRIKRSNPYNIKLIEEKKRVTLYAKFVY